MNSFLRIVVTVNAAQAAASINQVKGAVDQLQRAGGFAGFAASAKDAFGKTLAGLHDLASGIQSFGRNLQYTGRQLMTSFTLPIVAGFALAVRAELQNEEATTRLIKVYGTLGMSQAQVKSETDSLGRAFDALSGIFGVAKADVINIAADWAQAGASGIALAKATRLTLETMILGEIGATQASQSLLTIMEQYNLSLDETQKALAVLNVVENDTAVSFGGLIEAISRSGGTARTAGVDIRNLAALVAAMVPAAGSAEQAGNSLKTIFSRILAPTKAAAEVMGLMGINISEAAWQSQNGVERLQTLAKAFQDLTPAQQALASSNIATRFQINKFDVLMRDIINPLGNYQRALNASADDTKNFAQYQRELGIVLASNPQSFKILTTQLQNMLTRIIIPILPALLALTQYIVQLVDKFTQLSPQTQQWVLIGLAALAILPILAYYFGAVANLVGTLGKASLFAVGFVVQLGRALASLGVILQSIWQAVAIAAESIGSALAGSALGAAAAIAAVAAVVVIELIQLWNSVASGSIAEIGKAAVRRLFQTVFGFLPTLLFSQFAGPVTKVFGAVGHFIIDVAIKAWGLLPRIVQESLMAVWKTVVGVGQAIYKALSYLNPFARHSPSLVDNVQAGVDLIAAKYASLSDIGSVFRRAVDDIQAFNEATGGTTNLKIEKQRADIEKNAPENLGAFDNVAAGLQRLQSLLPAIQAQYDSQARVVDNLKASLDALNNTLDEENLRLKALKSIASAATDELNRLKGIADATNERLATAKDVYDRLSNVKPMGISAAQDQIFANEMAQKRLQLEILNMSSAAGMSVDEAKNKLAELQGAYETAQARFTTLRIQGAGSDVLGPLSAEMSNLQAAQAGINSGPLAQIKAAADQLAKLEEAGKRLNLEMSVTFDPMLRQLDQVKNTVVEMPFDQLLSKLTNQKAVVEQIQAEWDKQNLAVKEQQRLVDVATAAVEAQQKVIDGITERRDALQKTYDLEKQNLDDIKSAYQAVTSQIDSMAQALAGLASSSAAGAQATSPLADQFAAAGAGDFTQPQGSGVFNANEMGDINKLADQWIEEMKKKFGALDPFQALKDKLGGAVDWMKGRLSDFGGWIGDRAQGIFVDPIVGAFTRVSDALSGPVGWIRDMAGGIFSGVAEVASEVWGRVTDAVNTAWGVLEPIFKAVLIVITPIIVVMEILGGVVWEVMKAIGTVIFGVLNDLVFPIFKLIWEFISGALRPVFQMIGAVVEIVFALIWKAIELAWSTISPIFEAIVWFIREVLGPIFNWLWENVISPVFTWIGDHISAAWDRLSPIFGWIWGAIENVGSKFRWLYDNVIKPVFSGIVNFVKDRINNVIDIMNGIGTGINWVGKSLGVDIHVDPIPHVGEGMSIEAGGGGGNFATGGIPASTVGQGFRTNGIRAIVGEGRSEFPEYVVPTDPAYRANALNLLSSLQGDLGVPKLAGGGILGLAESAFNSVTGLVDIGQNIIEGLSNAALKAGIQGAVTIANAALGAVPDPFHSFGVGAVKMILEGVSGLFDRKEAEKAAMTAGGASGSGYGWQAITHYLDMMGQAYQITSTVRQGDGSSRHDIGDAVDLVGDFGAIAKTAMGALPAMFEGIWRGSNGSLSVKAGQIVDPSFWGASTWEQHGGGNEHVHLASYTGPDEGPGWPTGGPGDISVGGGGDFGGGDARAIGRRMAEARGWGSAAQWNAIDQIFTHESNWDPNSVNPSSGAYGIPQANPSGGQGHPYALGDIPGQIQWGYDYIAGRYGDPIGAWDFWQAHNWYEAGGILDALPHFLNGGTIPGLPGTPVPIMAHGGEEIVSVKQQQNSKASMVFNGDLSFPNITDPADAEEFISNLQALAR